MPLDHYVSQVHLKKFCAPMLGNRLYAIRKSDLKLFTPRPQDVCRIKDGSTNYYLRNDRAIEDFLKTIEPNYDDAVEKLKSEKLDWQCIYTIAGFVAYVAACSPAGIRINSGPIQSLVQATGEILDAAGLISPSPAESKFRGASLTELFEKESIEVVIDPKYPQAVGIDSICLRATAFGNFRWEILNNDIDNSPFFTSDFPVAIEQSADTHFINRIVPITPKLALRIIPNPTIDMHRKDFNFANFRFCSRKVNHSELVKLNRLLVRSAEDTVFYRGDRPWVQPFVAKNRHYRIEPWTKKIPSPDGKLLTSTHRLIARTSAV